MPLKIKYQLVLLSLSILLLSSCGKKPDQTTNLTPTPTPKLIELTIAEKPYIKLIPRQDGHELKLVITNIPNFVSQIEYELLYSAQDNGLEIEKGVGDTIKLEKLTPVIDRDLLLGTSSCTNGCKYKYDTGITGGTLSLNFYTQSGQVFTYQTTFTLLSSADIKKNKGLSLPIENLSIEATSSTTSDFFIVLKNFGLPQNSKASAAFSVFSNGSGKGKITSIKPETITKEDKNTLIGDYLQN